MPRIERIGDPISFAQEMQMYLSEQPFDKHISLASDTLNILGQMATEQDELSSQYLVDSTLSYWQSGKEYSPSCRVVVFSTLVAEGQFAYFSYFSLGSRNDEMRPINSLCLALTGVKLLPDGDRLPPSDAVHFPVLALEQATRVA